MTSHNSPHAKKGQTFSHLERIQAVVQIIAHTELLDGPRSLSITKEWMWRPCGHSNLSIILIKKWIQPWITSPWRPTLSFSFVLEELPATRPLSWTKLTTVGIWWLSPPRWYFPNSAYYLHIHVDLLQKQCYNTSVLAEHNLTPKGATATVVCPVLAEDK